MDLNGDQVGIAALKAMRDKNKEYLKFLLAEIKSNTDLRATFKDDAGQQFDITLDPKANTLTVTKK